MGKILKLKEKIMSITDKELLAICNLSNLKMEFANLKKEETKKETTDKVEVYLGMKIQIKSKK